MRFFLKKKKNKGNSWQTESSGKEPKVDKNRRDTQSSTATEPENLPLVDDPCDGVSSLSTVQEVSPMSPITPTTQLPPLKISPNSHIPGLQVPPSPQISPMQTKPHPQMSPIKTPPKSAAAAASPVPCPVSITVVAVDDQEVAENTSDSSLTSTGGVPTAASDSFSVASTMSVGGMSPGGANSLPPGRRSASPGRVLRKESVTVTTVEVDPAPVVKCVVTGATLLGGGDPEKRARGRNATRRSNSVCSGALKRQRFNTFIIIGVIRCCRSYFIFETCWQLFVCIVVKSHHEF